MKGKEIINNIAQDKMPNIEAVRVLCQTQPAPAKSRLRFKTVVAAVAVVVLLVTGVYAATEMVYRRVETGASFDIVILPDDEYGRQVYAEATEHNLTGYPVYWVLTDNQYIRRLDADAARFINEQVAGQIFMADGTPIDFEPVVSHSGIFTFGGYRFYDRGYELFTASGEPIGTIWLHVSRRGDLHSVQIHSLAEEASWRAGNATYADVVAAFGREPRLPTAYVDLFQAPRFRLTNFYLPDGSAWNVVISYAMQELDNVFDLCRDELRIFVEKVSEDTWHTRYYLGGEVIEHVIGEVIVYELRLPEMVTHFVWEYDGFSYSFWPSPLFTPQQTIEVIRSMIE